jgi:hypothetical protein
MGYLFFLLLVAIIGSYAWQATKALHRARASASWPVTDGSLRHVGPVEQTGGGRTGTYKYWQTAPRFVYLVNGKEYEAGSSILGSPMALSLRRREEFVLLPQGTPVQVFYNPVAPEEAVLTPGATVEHYGNCIMSWIALGIVAVAGAVMLLR